MDAHSQVLLACRRVAEAMDLFDEAASSSLALGRSDLRALNLLEDGPMPIGAMGRRLALTRAAMTSLVDRLERAGYVARSADPLDRRVTQVTLQPTTWQAFAALYRPLGQHVAAAVAPIPPDQQNLLAAGLELVATAFDHARAQLPRQAPG